MIKSTILAAGGVALALVLSVALCLIVGLFVKPNADGNTDDSGINRSVDTGAFADSRDGKSYGTVKIGEQVWMTENLHYETADSKSYGNEPSNCAKYGRLYTWIDALTACPDGWHLPNDKEWTALTDYVGGEKAAGTNLRSPMGWNSHGNVPVGTNEYGFSAMPGGYGDDVGNFYAIGNSGNWWSATEYDADLAMFRGMVYHNDRVAIGYTVKTGLFSVRCLRNN